jgi:lipooligosaccharide transport system permease protein
MNTVVMGFSPRAAFRVWQRNLTVYKRTYKMNILPNFFEPVIYLVAMGIGLGAFINRSIEGFTYLQYIAPGLIAASAMNGGTYDSTYNVFVKMYFGRTYEAITATPVNMEDAMIGEILWAITRGTIYGVIFSLVVAVMGLVQNLPDVVFLPPVIAITAWLFAGMGLLYTSMVKIIDMYSFYFTIFLTPLFLFSGIFFPVSSLPEWAQVAAWFTPLYHCVNIFKGVVLGTWSAGHWIDVVWVVVAALLTTSLAVYRIRRKFYQ